MLGKLQEFMQRKFNRWICVFFECGIVWKTHDLRLLLFMIGSVYHNKYCACFRHSRFFLKMIFVRRQSVFNKMNWNVNFIVKSKVLMPIAIKYVYKTKSFKIEWFIVKFILKMTYFAVELNLYFSFVLKLTCNRRRNRIHRLGCKKRLERTLPKLKFLWSWFLMS